MPPQGWKSLKTIVPEWDLGNAILGFGDQRVSSTLRYTHTLSAFFRKVISFHLNEYTDYEFSVLKDDGVIIYINEEERVRDNMPLTSINPDTTALTGVYHQDEEKFTTFNVPGSLINSEKVMMAAEVHNVRQSSSDLSFDLEILGKHPIHILKFGQLWQYWDKNTRPTNYQFKEGSKIYKWYDLGYKPLNWMWGTAPLVVNAVN